ncbi:lysophospholipid acyltransferase family protein [Streptomyces sp. NBC_01190]|uniref:lysophospholipid acyltransferase family protein n=1 Tax=Streptomyces sp. NBC_01190 TaxID=2903767 RepID=UPI00386D20F6|nr:1-acyl-sn-glycerol-3-phosphate acyltransferase [Streptomyces sp. NBC_01190]
MPHREIGLGFRLAAAVTRPPLALLLRRDWHGREHIPGSGGFIAVVNHNSYLDPVAYGQFQYSTGRAPRFLAKAELFRTGLIGAMLRGLGQIPVRRDSRDVRWALRAAVEAVERGEGVVFYPEGTLTRDPDFWPAAGRTGAARVALETRCPVVPVAQWGAHLVLPPYGKKPSLFPRKTHHVVAGPPLDLSAYYDRPVTSEMLTEITGLMMAAVTELLEGIRGESAPFRPAAGDLPAPPAPPAARPDRPRAEI